MFARSLVTLAKTTTRRTKAAPVKMRRVKLVSYGLFLRESRNHPLLKLVTGPARARTAGRLYRALSPAEKKALKQRASKVTILVRPRGYKAPRKPGPFAKFVKANYGKVRKLPAGRRLKTLAKLFKQQKQAKA
jgi:hypothetical protein